MTMLEKIERAILSCDAPCDDYFNRDVGMLLSVNPEAAEAIARAALLAMREPSVPMLGAGYSSQGNHPDDELMLIDAWPAMIDAILKEGRE